MNTNLQKEFKKRLLKEKERLEKELQSFTQKDPKFAGNYNTVFPDFGNRGVNVEENMDEVEEYVASLDIEYALEIQLKNINEALKKFEKGKYGICENCKKEISVERLQASPAAKICLKCK